MIWGNCCIQTKITAELPDDPNEKLSRFEQFDIDMREATRKQRRNVVSIALSNHV